MFVPFLLVMSSDVFYEPKLRGIVHVGEIEFWKLFDFVFHFMTDIAAEAKYFGNDRVYFYFDASSSEDFIASL